MSDGGRRWRAAGRDLEIAEWEISWSFARSSGAGGQNVNKVESKAVLEYYVQASRLPNDIKDRFISTYASRLKEDGCLRIASEKTRDRERNRQDALDRLQELISAVAAKPKPRRPTRPTRGSVERRLTGKRITSERKRNRRPNRDEG
jgi:ribosome-associated protein